ncbi:hypothetical protein H3R26_06780 [Lactobacillus sp. W8092]|nr:hypothetical protein [Lactobacillus sp. W8092]
MAATAWQTQMQELDQQILQLFAEKLTVAQQAFQQTKTPQLSVTQANQIKEFPAQYQQYLAALVEDLQIITHQYQAHLLQNSQSQ